ncbi:unnamed protein product [Polarella glacialis]|uniref:Uncharacterized protein n=1 Tax=Polarella glacialis TaxID=89957 RepID=A0A813KZ32_POLGL|nr:unnamed protein product [Polarella glacialis]
MAHVMKKPASANAMQKPPAVLEEKVYVTTLTKCTCGGKLCKGKDMPAMLYGTEGNMSVTHRSKRCCRKNCRTYFGYNYCTKPSGQFNTVRIDDVDVLFANDKVAFTKKFLEYHDSLQFRGYLSTGAIGFAFDEVLADGRNPTCKWFSKTYQDARLLRLAMEEFALMGDDYIFKIKIGSEVCAGAPSPKKRGGRPSTKRTKQKPYTNGWFMLSDPSDGRILSVVQQFEPENNAVVFEAIGKVIDTYPECDGFIMDRCCKVAPEAKRRDLFPQIKYWATDVWHGEKHSDACKHTMRNVRALKTRFKGVNTSVAEQIFSWFRGYARTFNEMKDLRHMFLVVYYCKRHNMLIDNGDTKHLNKFSTHKKAKKVKKSYECIKKRDHKNKNRSRVKKNSVQKRTMKAKKAMSMKGKK